MSFGALCELRNVFFTTICLFPAKLAKVESGRLKVESWKLIFENWLKVESRIKNKAIMRIYEYILKRGANIVSVVLHLLNTLLTYTLHTLKLVRWPDLHFKIKASVVFKFLCKNVKKIGLSVYTDVKRVRVFWNLMVYFRVKHGIGRKITI